MSGGSAWRPEIPDKCQAMVTPEGGWTQSQMRNWPVTAEKCLNPPTLIMGFRCEYGHSGQTAKCDLHGQDDGTQLCGYCALKGHRVPAKVAVVRRLKP